MKAKAEEDCNKAKGIFHASTCRCVRGKKSHSHSHSHSHSKSKSHSQEVTQKPKCKCKCSPDCKKRKLIIDVLLKFFYRDVYDKECCKKNCDCPEGSSLECEESSNSKEGNYDVLVKLFKPEDEEAKVEVSDANLPADIKEKVNKIVQGAVKEIEQALEQAQQSPE
jgi:hypothetical protein